MSNDTPSVDKLTDEVATPKVSPKHPWVGNVAMIVSPPSCVTLRDKLLLSTKSFNVKYADKAKTHDPFKVAIKDKRVIRYDALCYRPGHPDVVEENGRTLFNLHVPQAIEPLAEPPDIFLRHIEYLIPDKQSREWFLDWLAWLVQHPDRKTMFAILLLGPHGTGKSWIGELMKIILGSANVSEPNKKRVASDFNGWIARRQLIIIHELYERGARGLADALKDYITQTNIPVNLKNVEAFEIDNFANFLTITNHEDAIPIDPTERRWLVIRCAFEPMYPAITEEYAEYYGTLWDCIGTPAAPGEEARRVMAFLQARTITLDCEGFAPLTEAREEVIDAGRSSLEKVLAEAYKMRIIKSVFNPVDLLSNTELMQSVTHAEQNQRTLEKILRNLRCRPIKTTGTVRTKYGRKRLWARSPNTAASFAKLSHRELAARYEGKPVEVGEIE